MENNNLRSNSSEEKGVQTTISRQFDWDEIRPSVAVTRVVSIVMNREPTACEPLYETIDADSLNQLLQSTPHPPEFELSFRYLGIPIVISGDGTVTAFPDC